MQFISGVGSWLKNGISVLLFSLFLIFGHVFVFLAVGSKVVGVYSSVSLSSGYRIGNGVK